MKRIVSIFLVLVLVLTAIPLSSMALSQYGYVTGGWLRLRSSPSFSASTVSSYYTGTSVKILGTSGSWYQVEAPDGNTGYMYASYITFSGGGGGTGTAYVTSSNGLGVRMRSGPSTGYRILGVYSVGTAVTVLESGTSWSRIQIGSRVGYMMNKFLTTSGGGGGGTGYTATVWSSNGYGVRLRSGPGTSYSVIGVYSVGTAVTVLTHGTTWDYISVGSRRGYMMNSYLTTVGNSYVTSFSFDKTTATATVTSAGGTLDVTPTILGTNLTSPYFTLAVSSNASSYVTATRNASTGKIAIDISNSIPDNTVFTVTGTTLDKSLSGSTLKATITVTAVKTGTLSSIVLTPVASTLNQGESTQINAKLVYSNGSYVNNAPSSMYTLSVVSGGSYGSVSGDVFTAATFTGTTSQPVTIRGYATANTAITNDCTVTVKALTVPGAPTLVTAKAENGQVKLTWTAPSDNGGSAIDAYKVYYNTTSTISASPYTTISSGSTYTQTVGSLTNGTLYYFWVVAHNAQGDSAASNSLSATPNITVPDAPTGLTVTSTSDGTIDVSWTAPAYDGGSSIIEYNVYYTTSAYTTSATTSKTVTGLTNGTTYTLFVKARNAQGESLASNAVTATPAAVPGQPTNVVASGAASVTWTAPSSNGSTITGYTVRYSTDSSFATYTDQSATTNSCVISLTAPGTWYFKVYATNAIGTGIASDAANLTVTQVETPTMSPAEGTSNDSATVTLSCATAGATIRYTTDGTDPDSSDSAYSSPITVSTTTTIKAKAFATGMVASGIATGTYTIKVGTAPEISPAGGTYTGAQSVTLTIPTGTTVYYSLNSGAYTQYTAAITVDTTGTTLEAYAARSGCENSDHVTATYTIN